MGDGGIMAFRAGVCLLLALSSLACSGGNSPNAGTTGGSGGASGAGGFDGTAAAAGTGGSQSVQQFWSSFAQSLCHRYLHCPQESDAFESRARLEALATEERCTELVEQMILARPRVQA